MVLASARGLTMPDEQREDRSAETDIAMLRRAAAVLAENFDTVQIFCSRHLGDDGTVGVKYGTGNWFARIGQVKEWVNGEDSAVEAQQFKRSDSEDDP